MTRTISGIFYTLTGAIAALEDVAITLEPGFYDPQGVYLPSTWSRKTDADGRLTVTLVVGGRYAVQAGTDVFSFTLPGGTEPLSWSEVRSLGQPITPELEPTIAAFIDGRIEGVGGSVPLEPYADYPGGANTAIRALIDRKAEKTDLGNPQTDFVLLLENALI